MKEKSVFHAALNYPFVYNFVQKLFFRSAISQAFINLMGDYKGLTILDVGCGPGVDSPLFSSAHYYGVDLSQKSIDYANATYGKYGQFFCSSVESLASLNLPKIDIVILKGLLHHLSDDQIKTFFSQVSEVLSVSGRLFSIDPVFIESQHPISHLLVSLDRGFYVRTIPSYLALLDSSKMSLLSQHVLTQSFPPYDRLVMQMGYF
ncbi:MAG: class I SAM-dependent methyltransferase [bacterium]